MIHAPPSESLRAEQCKIADLACRPNARYFTAWLEGYTQQYAEWAASAFPPTPKTERRRSKFLLNRRSSNFEGPVNSQNYNAYLAAHAQRQGVDGAALPIKPFEEALPAIDPDELQMARRPSVTPDQLPLHLSLSFKKALEAFFTQDSHFQLNLDSEIVNRVLVDAQHSPDPHIFKKSTEAVEVMLKASLNKYLREISGNAGRYRSIFAV